MRLSLHKIEFPYLYVQFLILDNPFLMIRYYFFLVLLICFKSAQCQLSFAPVDTLEYSTGAEEATFQFETVYNIDVDLNGFDDLLYLKGNSIYYRTNTGVNTFGEEKKMYTDPKHIFSASNFADVDNDTYPDIVISTSEGMKLLLLKGSVFVNAQKLSAPNNLYRRITLFDSNKDGKVDLLAARNNSITLFSDVNTGFAVTSVKYSSPTKAVDDFEFRDMNADNIFDLVVLSFQNSFEILLGNVNNTFTSVYSKPLAGYTGFIRFEIGDLNLDGFQDVTLLLTDINLFTLTYNNTNQSIIEQPLFASGSRPTNMYSFRLIDLKNNGTLDIVYNDFFTLTARENNGIGQFLTPVTITENYFAPLNFRLFNFDNDGVKDILYFNTNKYQLISFNSNSSVKSNISDGYFDDYRHVLYHDIDGDGFKDIISISNTGSLSISWGTVNHDYSTTSRYKIPVNAFYGAIADATGDGKPDVLITRESQTNSINEITILKNKGNRQFDDAQAWKYFPLSGKPIVADLDKNGTQDFISFSRTGNTIGWLDVLNAEYNEFNTLNHTFTISGNVIRTLASADINSDGYIDLLTTNLVTKNFTILINNKTGNFIEQTLQPASSGTISDVFVVGAMDYNKDQHNDLLVVIEVNSTNVLQVYLNDGLGNFTYNTSLNMSNIYVPDRIDVFDIDADQDLDIIVSAWDFLSTNVFINTNGVFSLATQDFKSVGQSSRIYEDLNGDGMPDAFSATLTNGNKFIQLNNSVLEPQQVLTTISIEEILYKSVKIALSPTNSDGRMVVITKGNQPTFAPTDNHFYSSNTKFGLGNSVGVDSYVVHAGKSNLLEITGLNSNQQYLISVFEYNVNDPQVTIINYTTTKADKTFTTPNSPPQIATIPKQSGVNFKPVHVILNITDEDNIMSELSYTITSSNTSVIPQSNLILNTSGAKPVLDIIPVAEGESLIEITVKDGVGNTASASFQYISLIVGLEEEVANTFNIFPNPFKTKVEISSPNENHSLMIYDSKGRQIMKFKTIPEIVDLSEYPVGLYFFISSDGKFARTVKQ